MRILIAEDDAILRLGLATLLRKLGHEVTAAKDGAEAWRLLQADDPPPLAIFDWMMPGAEGVELCRRVRADARRKGMYVILLTALGGREHVTAGLRAGANDFVTKPFDPEELEARVNVGARVVQLQAELAGQVRALEAALAQVKRLQGLLPICCYCKSIRDDHDYWHRVEHYLTEHSEARFSHSICPGCWNAVVVPQAEQAGIQVPRKEVPA